MKRLRRNSLLALSAAVLLLAAQGAIAIEVNFAAPVLVGVVGEPVEIEVFVNYEPQESIDLFSFGVQMVPNQIDGMSVDKIEVAPELDNSGFVAGALTDGKEFGAKGNVSFGGAELVPYGGSLLASFWVTVDRVGPVELSLDFFRTAGPNEDIFLDIDGTTLDSAITFGMAILYVIERPALMVRRTEDGTGVEVFFDVAPPLHYRLFRSDDLNSWEEIANYPGTSPSPVIYTELVVGRPLAIYRVEAGGGG